MALRRGRCIAPALALLVMLATTLIAGALQAPANAHFQQRWSWTDKPVALGEVSRTWMWGPGAFTGALTEDYAESPDGERVVQYFDKARMEITHPDAHAPNLWYVTNGLLAQELMTGQLQVSDDTFEYHQPAEIVVAGDMVNNPKTPTYAAMNRVAHLLAYESGHVIDDTLDRNGATGRDSSLARYDVNAYYYVAETQHQVAEPFWYFMTSTGPVWSDDQIISERLFPDPFYATGLPITEAYWVRATVAGVETDVLVQAFERRVLTYTPSNPAGWQIESGNVGRHYYAWRYGTPAPDTETVKIHMIAREDHGQTGMPIGCNDSLIPVQRNIPASDTIVGKIEATLNELLSIDDEYYGESGFYNALHQSDLTVDHIVLEHNIAEVHLDGDLVVGGACDEPRVQAQLEHAALQFAGVDDVVILVDGEPAFPMD